MFLRGHISGSKISVSAYYRTLSSRLRINGRQSVHLDVTQGRPFSVQPRYLSAGLSKNENYDFLTRYKESFNTEAPLKSIHLSNARSNEEQIGKTAVICGFLGKRRDLSDGLSFADLLIPESQTGLQIQVVSKVEDSQAIGGHDVHQKFKNIKTHSAVSISGVLRLKRQPRGNTSSVDVAETYAVGNLELVLQDVTCLAAFPDDIIVSNEVQFGPESRHLQIRFDAALRNRLLFRNKVLRECRLSLEDFQEIETPILFKSTPEGAREFLVPTRRPGYAYALPQSPQQYKQILMASGIYRYFQIAKCFRDEDLRADRQPEFTQIDLEMAFSDGETVMTRMEAFICSLFGNLQKAGAVVPTPKPPFLRLPYSDAMLKFGSDKPDLRIPDRIHKIDSIISKTLIDMITTLHDPIVDAWKIRLSGDSSRVRTFIQNFMDTSEALPFRKNPDGSPGIFVYDPRKPLEGLQAFGYEGLDALKKLYVNASLSNDNFAGVSSSNNRTPNLDEEPFQEGDLIVIQARPRAQLFGGSTSMGRFRNAIYKAALSRGLITQDITDRFLWVIDFPLFTLNNDVEPGQGGTAGFSATHHPFTAPKTARDVDLLLTNPLEATADHYDLVLNGIELGGGSRRIHDFAMQQFIMRDVLKMNKERLKDFSHLFEVLRAGCPPHAGIALGLDRLIAVMLGVESVRDVIAFPKSGRGEDLLVKSPSIITKDQQEMYHIKVQD